MADEVKKKRKSLPPEPLTSDEVYRLMSACGTGFCGLRDRAILMIWWRTGIRCSEALNLQARDIDAVQGGLIVRVRHGKKDNNRTVALGPDAAGAVEAWLAVWREHFGHAKTLFCTIKRQKGVNGKKMSRIAARKLLGRLKEKSGLEKRIHAHGFRHTFALELDTEGKPLRVIQQAMGHKNAQTTSMYLQSLGGREVVGALQARTLPAKT